MASQRIVVVGGGLSGLTAALALADRGARPAVLEADVRWGGQVRTARHEGWIVEEGAEAFTAGSEVMRRLLERLHLAEAVTRQRSLPSLVLLNGRLDLLGAGEAAAMLGIRSSGGEAAGLATMTDGMDSLARCVVSTLDRPDDVRLRSTVRHLRRRGAGWTLETDDGPLDALAVVLAVPPAAAAQLLAPLAEDAARIIAALPARSSLTVSLAYARDAVSHPLDATGFVIPPGTPAPEGLAACTFASSKFAGRCPPEVALLRVFFRPPADGLARGSDAWWAGRAHEALGPVLGIVAPPLGSWVSRWPRALPDHGSEYADAVEHAERLLCNVPALVLAGSAYHGPGVEGAVRSGAAAPDRLES